MSNATGQSAIDFVVVGAGLSGLSAAWALKKDGRFSVKIVEAASRLGGKTLNHQLLSGKSVDRGGTWVGPTQTALLALAAERDIKIENGKPTGKTFYGFRGAWNQVEFASQTAPLAAQQDFQEAMARFESLLDTVCTDAPWLTPDAAALDALSNGEWILTNTHYEESRAWFTGCIRKLQGGDPDKTSLLWMLQFIASATFKYLPDKAEDYRFVGGAHGLSVAIAARLGSDVVLDAAVTQIDQSRDDLVRITTRAGEVEARPVIVATMPSMVRQIAFWPTLPALHQHVADHWETMSWIEFHALFDKPLWRGRNVGSQFLCLERLVEASDISPDDECRGKIVGFILPASPGRHLAERDALCRRFLKEVYGEGADEPNELTIFDWNEQPWIGGCVSSRGPGVLTDGAAGLVAPFDRVFWAGTERSSVWVNYMEGAVRSGQRAASEAMARLLATSGLKAETKADRRHASAAAE